MKIEAKSNNTIEQKENQIQLTEEDTQLLELTNMPFSQIIAQELTGEADNLNGINQLNFDFNYDSLSMDYEDAMFFINLAQNVPYIAQNSTNGEFQALVQTEVVQNVVSPKSVEVSNKLTELIEKAQNTQKPVRISFDNDVSVIIKIDKHGKISAEFIPGSLEVENYLRNNIASLKQKFDEQNLPYNDLLYRQNSRQNRNKNKDKGEQ